MVTWSVTCSIGDFPLGFPWAACFGWRTLFSLCLPQRDVNVYDFKGITSIRRNYSAFLYRIVLSNPIAFCGTVPRNIENRGDASGYVERVRIKGEHLRKRIRTKPW